MDYDEYLAELRAPIQDALGLRDDFPPDLTSSRRLSPEFVREWVSRVRRYDDLLAPALVPMKLISMYGSRPHEQELTRTLQMVAHESTKRTGLDILTALREYPALLLTYTAALGAIAKQNYSMLRAVTADVQVAPLGSESMPFILTSGSQSVVGLDQWQALGTVLCNEDQGEQQTDAEIEMLLTGRRGRRRTSISDHLFTVLAPLFRQQFASDHDYADAFDRAEVLLDAVSEDARAQGERFYGPHGGYGRYTWRHRDTAKGPEAEMLAEAQGQGAGWTPLLGGLFGGVPERSVRALEEVASLATRIRSPRW
ncbi:hypothetical protein L332_13010 [Agrococcus pavilionensis RW1]|uniref:Uncharacterized protein n=1 Tax=Agrococcus pavilionensis RW1 TaxID=1330458 RepID=U1LDR3_9MICO|nr:hypothetical protein [Agrococcus pavilionensis]ERG65353.1 hypothetical protein L332_13010 [Agrococcus pavilionensis RW1]